jgi:hypothetical protein
MRDELERAWRASGSPLSFDEWAPLWLHRRRHELELEQKRRRAEEIARIRAEREELEREQARERNRAEVVAKLKGKPRGPYLEPAKRHHPLRVNEQDLDPLIPDGWGRKFIAERRGAAEDADRLAARLGLPPHAVVVLVLLEWVWHALGHALSGAAAPALVASPEWLARKAGCHERWMHEVLNRLDPKAAYRRARLRWALEKAKARRRGEPEPPEPKATAEHRGTVYASRFRDLRKFSLLSGREHWLDRTGEPRRWVDLTGVIYPTAECARALRRRAKRATPRRSHPPELYRSPMRRELARLLQPLELTLMRRCRAARREASTPRSHLPAEHVSIPRRERSVQDAQPATGPPGGGGVPSGDGR